MPTNYYDVSGLSSSVKFGKTGGAISYDLGQQTFSLTESNGSLYAGLAVKNIDVISGDISLITGKLNINGATLQWQQSGVLRFGGSTALMIPSGNDAARPITGLVGMIRINTQAAVRIEYFDGTTWQIVGGNSLPTTGGTMTGDIVMSNGSKVTGLPDPVLGSDAVNKQYVDSAINGLSWKQAVAVLSTTNVNVSGPSSASIGGATLSAGDRVLLTNQTNNSQNGIWVFNGVGLPMNRTLDATNPTQLNGAAVFVQVGTRADTGWTQVSTLTTSFAGQVWVQFTSGTSYQAGTGLTLVGNTFYVNIGEGLTIDVNGGISVYPEFGTAIQLNSNSELTLKLDQNSGLLQSAAGLKIGQGMVLSSMLAGAIENSKLLYSTFNITNGVSSIPVALGDTLGIIGSGAVSTTLSSGQVNVSVATASSSTIGVASFDATNFNIVGGNVSVNIIDAGQF